MSCVRDASQAHACRRLCTIVPTIVLVLVSLSMELWACELTLTLHVQRGGRGCRVGGRALPVAMDRGAGRVYALWNGRTART